MLLGAILLASVTSATDPDFSSLQETLEQYGFQVKLELPPEPGAYGLLNSSSRTIWINPVVFELGIARPTLVHEAVHAAQTCAGGDKLSSLNLKITPPPMTRRYFLRYRASRRHLEAEAYTVQVQPDAVELAISLLHQHCS